MTNKKREQKLRYKAKMREQEHGIKDALILGPYKEPLQPVKDGHGYVGALTFDVKGRLQCHICGLLFDNLGLHIKIHDAINADEYREKFGLGKTTRLISEGERERRKIAMIKMYAALTPEQKIERKKHFMEMVHNAPKKWDAHRQTAEYQNKRGICPAQLIEIMRQAADEEGKLSWRDLINFHQTLRFKRPIYRTFGSWGAALKAAGLKPRQKGVDKGVSIPRYSNDDLLDMIRTQYEETGKIPTASDCSRGFLPTAGLFIKRFGSFPNARKMAGIPI